MKNNNSKVGFPKKNFREYFSTHDITIWKYLSSSPELLKMAIFCVEHFQKQSPGGVIVTDVLKKKKKKKILGKINHRVMKN